MVGRIRTPHGLALALLLLWLLPATAQEQTQDTGQVDLVPTATEADQGPKISLDVQDADIGTVLRSLASFSGTNIVASPRVEGKVTVKLEDVPWRQALSVILRAHAFDYVDDHGIIRVDTAEDLRQEMVAVKRTAQEIEQLERLSLGIVNAVDAAVELKIFYAIVDDA